MRGLAGELLYASIFLGIGMALGLALSRSIVFAEAKAAPIVAPVRACPPRQDPDKVCAAWLFQSDLAAAKRRMCGRPN